VKILAIDLGTHTGWCLGDAGKIPAYGTLTLAKPKEIKQFGPSRFARTDDPRIRRLWKWVQELCTKEQPNVVIWEDVQFSTFTFQTQLWSSLRTALQLGARSAHDRVAPMVFECVPVTTLKKFACTGSAQKHDMRRALLKKHPEVDIKEVDDNAIDAIWLFKWAEYFLARTFKPITNEQPEPESKSPDEPANLPECGSDQCEPDKQPA
jgi:hypothetical protein